MWVKRDLLCWPERLLYQAKGLLYHSGGLLCRLEGLYHAKTSRISAREPPTYVIGFCTQARGPPIQPEGSCIGRRASCIHNTSYCFSQGPPSARGPPAWAKRGLLCRPSGLLYQANGFLPVSRRGLLYTYTRRHDMSAKALFVNQGLLCRPKGILY